MNRYENSTQRAVCGIAAVAMTAITLGLSVVLPAIMNSGSGEPGVLATSEAGMPASARVVIDSSTGVVAAHESESMTTQCTMPDADRRPET